MTIRLIPTTYASPAAALAACGAGDTIIFEAAANSSYTNQDLSTKGATANITWLNQKGSKITITLINNTSLVPGNGWIFGSIEGSDSTAFDFSCVGSPGGAGGCCYISSGKSVTMYDTCIHGNSSGGTAVRLEAGASNAILAARRCQFQAYTIFPNNALSGASVQLTTNGGSTSRAILSAYDTIFYGQGASGGTGIECSAGVRGQYYTERCTFRTMSWGIYLPGIFGTNGSTSLYCEFYNLAIGIAHAATLNPQLVIKRCTFGNNSITDYLRNVNSKTNVVVDSCWFETMEVQAGAAWTKNGYETCTAGTPGASDFVCSHISAAFTNWASSNFDIASSSSLLVGTGNDAAGEHLDRAGRPAVVGLSDVGAYELQCTDPAFGETTLNATCAGTVGDAVVSWTTASMDGSYDLFGIYSGSTQLGTVGITTGSFAVTGTVGEVIVYTLKARSGCDSITWVTGPTASFSYSSVADWGGTEELSFFRLSETAINIAWDTSSITGVVNGYDVYADDVLVAELGLVDECGATASFLSTHTYKISLIDECGYEVDGPTGSFYFDWLIPTDFGCFKINPSNHNIQSAVCVSFDHLRNIEQVPLSLSLPVTTIRKNKPYRVGT